MTPAFGRKPSIGRRTLLIVLACAGTASVVGVAQPLGGGMEDPKTWDRATASLASIDLDDPHWGWAFLAVQRLVRDLPPDRDRFTRLLKAEQSRRAPPGPSLAFRLASALRDDGLTLPTADTPDPHGEIARERYQLVQGWSRTP